MATPKNEQIPLMNFNPSNQDDDSSIMEKPPSADRWKGVLSPEACKAVRLNEWVPKLESFLTTNVMLGEIRRSLCEIVEACDGRLPKNSSSPVSLLKNIFNKKSNKKNYPLSDESIYKRDVFLDVRGFLTQAIIYRLNAHGQTLTDHNILSIYSALFKIGCLMNKIFVVHRDKYLPPPDEQGNLPCDALVDSRLSFHDDRQYRLNLDNPQFDDRTTRTKIYALCSQYGNFEKSQERFKIIYELKVLRNLVNDLYENIPKQYNQESLIVFRNEGVFTSSNQPLQPLQLAGLIFNLWLNPVKH